MEATRLNLAKSNASTASLSTTLEKTQVIPQETLGKVCFANFISNSNPHLNIPIHDFPQAPPFIPISNGDLATPLENFGRAHGSVHSHYDHSFGILDEKRMRRMISNRESARRSRLRKKKQIEELQLQVDNLRSQNNHLSEKLIGLLESNHQVMQENAQLKEKVSSLDAVISNLLAPFRSNNGGDEVFQVGSGNSSMKSEENRTINRK